MRELAPPKSVIPAISLIQLVEVKYAEEYIMVEPMDSRVLYIVSELGCWRY